MRGRTSDRGGVGAGIGGGGIRLKEGDGWRTGRPVAREVERDQGVRPELRGLVWGRAGFASIVPQCRSTAVAVTARRGVCERRLSAPSGTRDQQEARKRDVADSPEAGVGLELLRQGRGHETCRHNEVSKGHHPTSIEGSTRKLPLASCFLSFKWGISTSRRVSCKGRHVLQLYTREGG